MQAILNREKSMRRFLLTFALLCTCVIAVSACSRKSNTLADAKSNEPNSLIFGYALSGPLISSRTTMTTAWEYPKNPLMDPALNDKSKLSEQIRWGFRLFTDTPHDAPRFAPGRMTCNNCHLNAGQREKSLPLVNVAGMFPEYNRRSGRLYSLGDRIVDCFLRSENATGSAEDQP